MARHKKSITQVYGIENWGTPYFRINRKGNVCVDVHGRDGQTIDLLELMEQVRSKGIDPPVLLRFPQILETQIQRLHQCFQNAIQEFEYSGNYQAVFPMKVNHRREVIEDILSAGKKYRYGLEVGSKPELFVALALQMHPEALLVCNGYKDSTYLRLVLDAHDMGRSVVLVMESLDECRLLLKIFKREKREDLPMLGMRIKLTSRGSGKWEQSGGDQSKFGLTSSQILEAMKLLEKAGCNRYLKMLHFHIGSQITEIRRIKSAIREAARFYSKLKRIAPSLQYLNVGGGLGVDYDGSRTSSDASANYTMQEYANDVVYTIMEVSDNEDVEEPTIVSESGRAVVSYHSILVSNVLRDLDGFNKDLNRIEITDEHPQVLIELHDIFKKTSAKNYREYYHDAIEKREELLSLFNLGYLSLEDRALGEDFFWAICHKTLGYSRRAKGTREEWDALARSLTGKVIVNLSVFQSLPDYWALEQLFPIMPLHRHHEPADRNVVLADITCDSDGVIDRFIDIKEDKEFLELHPPSKKPYYMGFFLVGAYQDIIGDFHNLFGKTNEVHVLADPKGGFLIKRNIAGDTINVALRHVRYDADALLKGFISMVENAVEQGNLSKTSGKKTIDFYREGLTGYTYLKD
ncbi:MAG: biosynthetic arginine decarboxylase [Candidatus Alcyoniella australis]|nr:biosynthetic arginine decarboxylase [Candidatus Alcyoniella australis]